ncbi:hypothetical protein VPH35_101735 [Triticum aestivum]|uniref:Uncharacterized protein n=1 Tax=Aegilops tauschii TaxID=37682 RepID=N1QWF6_AEGTA
MADAWTIPEKLPRALFMTGGVEVLLGLMVCIFRRPQGMFLSHPVGYHAALICATAWGAVPILAGIWFSLTELRPRVAVALLILTVFPLLLVIALAFGGFLATAPPK